MSDYRFRADDFDADLLAVVPGAAEVLATVTTTLYTFGGTFNGRLNHPATWDGTAYFGCNPATIGKPDWFHTSHPLVEATWSEVARDAWVHTYLVVVDGVSIWDARRLQGAFLKLMFHTRAWTTMPGDEADGVRGRVLASVIAATDDLKAHIAGREAS